MKTNLTKREFLQLSSVGGVAAAMGLLTGTKAEAKKLPPGDNLTELAQSITAISYMAGFGFLIAAIFKFKQHKDNPTQGQLALISAVWTSIDGPTATALTALGYSPQFLVDAVEHAKDGDTSDLIAFFNDLKLLVEC
jgi:Holliday junction resolvasome RuvABC DNA-binding subunit